MKISQLINSNEIIKTEMNLDTEIDWIASDTRQTLKNAVFVALKGTRSDGNEYIEKALKMGACAFVTENTEFYEKNKSKGILVKNARSILAKMWSNYYGNPAKGMKVVAITGTNGKTSTAYYLYNILKKSNIVCGLISTIEIKISNKKIKLDDEMCKSTSAMTTPDPDVLYKVLSIMKKEGVRVVVMEASSHALALHKLDGLEVDVGAFTNLSSEHLDFHKNMDDYFSAKEQLFKKCNIGIVNFDDEYGKILKNKYKCRIFTISCREKADYQASKIVYSTRGIKYAVKYENVKTSIKSKNIGEFTAYNTLMAIACASALGINDKNIKEGIWETETVKGRLERYRNKNIYIDYAHTPEATKRVLKSLRMMYPRKKIIALFGCGGDRDKTKRPETGKICSMYADFSIITSDNSRSENANDIISDILEGYNGQKNYKVIPNRAEAIRYGVKITKNNAILVLLGKGHEEYEINKDGQIPFDERKILSEIYDKC